MKKGEKKKQQKALKRRTERKAEHRVSRDAASVGPGLRLLREARGFPLLGCWTMPTWKETGIAPVVVARRQPDGLVLFATFLVDYYCLGVKSVYYNIDLPYTRFISEALPQMMMGERPLEVEPGVAHEMIYGSIEYAARWGFRPHRDFRKGQLVLDPVEAHPITGEIEFGHEGKPLYVSGPHDNPKAIINQLARTAGVGNFDYIVNIGEPPPTDSWNEGEWEELEG
jgi:hypothetical protein